MLVLVGVTGRRSPLLGRAAPCFTAGGGGVQEEEEERRLDVRDSGLFLFLKYEVLLNCAFNAKKLRRKSGIRPWLSMLRIRIKSGKPDLDPNLSQKSDPLFRTS